MKGWKNKYPNPDKQLEGFTLGLALWDMLPVLLFGGSTLCIAGVFHSLFFLMGAFVCILSGCCKVLWKLILALKKRNVWILSRQMRFLMPAGFLVMILSLFFDRKKIHPEAIWKLLRVPYVYVPFLVGVLGFAVMFLLSLFLNQKDARNNKLEQTVNAVTQGILFLGVAQICYLGNYYPAQDVEPYLAGDEMVKVSVLEEGLFFDGSGTDRAMVFYPGAKVEAEAYAPLLYNISKETGMDCFLLEMPGNLAVYGGNLAGDIMAAYDYQEWYLSGHSLGGTMACSYAAGNLEKVKGVILFASYSSKNLGMAAFPVLSIYGSEDGVLNRGRLEKAREKMPEHYTEMVIEGGNHAWFGNYGEQKGDRTATISHEQQWQQTAELIKQFIMENCR